MLEVDAVADPGFPREEAPTPERGRGMRPSLPLRSATEMLLQIEIICKDALKCSLYPSTKSQART